MWIASGPRNAIAPRQRPHNGPGMRGLILGQLSRAFVGWAKAAGTAADLRGQRSAVPTQGRSGLVGTAVPASCVTRRAGPPLPTLPFLFLQLVPRAEHPPHDRERSEERR